jgi:hypothetical protein
MDVAAFLERREQQLLTSAEAAVARAHLAHYEAAGVEATDERLRALLEVVITSCRAHHLDTAISYARSLATRRQSTRYSLTEVQTAINVLEEAIWSAIMADLAAESQGYALGLVSTVLGAIKDAVACGYLAEISARPVRSLQVDSLFSGTERPAREV